MTLRNETQDLQIFSQLELASDFWSRSRGLLGRAGLGEMQALWIHRCNSIHTFGMKFTIDCVFLDRNLKVKKIVPHVRPHRLVWPIWGASSVIEMAEGLASTRFAVGDQLHVGH